MHQLGSNQLGTPDESYPVLVKNLVNTPCYVDLRSWERKGL